MAGYVKSVFVDETNPESLRRVYKRLVLAVFICKEIECVHRRIDGIPD